MERNLEQMDVYDIPMGDIDRDANTQVRATDYQDAVKDYADTLEAGLNLPPVDLFRIGSSYIIADGWHRFWAHLEHGAETISARVHTGDEEDCRLFAAGSNQDHGIRRTNADKRRAVEVVLDSITGAQWSSNRIAEHCGVSNHLVDAIRTEREPDQVGEFQPDETEQRVGKDGKKQSARKKSGKTEKSPKPDPKPKPSPAGKEVTSPAQRLKCKELFGQFMRACDAAQTEDGEVLSAVIDPEIKAIARKLKEHWGGPLK